MDFSYVLGELEKGRGTQFDPKYVDILLNLIHTREIDINKMYGIPMDESTQGTPEENAESPAETPQGKEA